MDTQNVAALPWDTVWFSRLYLAERVSGSLKQAVNSTQRFTQHIWTRHLGRSTPPSKNAIKTTRDDVTP